MSDYFLNKIYDSLLNKKPVPKKPEPIVEKKESFKPLSKVYEVLVREKVEHHAVYSTQRTVDPNNIPDYTDQGLETVGVVSDEVVKRIKKQVGFETTDIAGQVKSLIKQNNMGDRKQRAFDMLYKALEASDIDTNQLLRILSDSNNPGTFNVLESQTYNCITAAMQSIQNHPIAKESPFNNESLKSLLQTILPLDPQFASTNVGPGELYFIVFSNGTTGGGDGAKSGDIQLGSESIEVKATGESGARLGGTDQIRDGYTYILQQIKQSYKFIPSKWLTVIQALKEIQNFTKEEEIAVKQEQKTPDEGFINLKNNVDKVIKKYLRVKGDLNPSGLIANKFIRPDVNSLYTPVTKDGKLGKGAANRSFIEYFKSLIDERINVGENEIKKFEEMSRDPKYLAEGRLDEFLYGALTILQNRPDVTNDILIDIISAVNSYSPNYVKNDLQSFFKNKTPQQIITEYTGGSLLALNKLIGAMHLLSYTKEIKCTKYLLVNSRSGNCLVANAPTNIEQALEFVTTSGVNIDTSFDRPEGSKTARAKSVNIEYHG
jgi:hypothetical protein